VLVLCDIIDKGDFHGSVATDAGVGGQTPNIISHNIKLMKNLLLKQPKHGSLNLTDIKVGYRNEQIN
jgi:hypothetical protein